MAVKYVNPKDGSDSNTGTNYFVDAWGTLQYALDSVSAGDTIRLMNTETHFPSATIDVDTTSGSVDAPITIQGADEKGNPLTKDYAVIDGSNISSGSIIKSEGSFQNFAWERVRLTNATGNAVENLTTAQSYDWTWRDCRIDNSSSYGIRIESNHWSFIRCEIDNNGSYGFGADAANRASYTFLLNCSIHDNGGYGALFYDENNRAIGNVFYNNTEGGVLIRRYPSEVVIIGNIFFNNGGSGINFSDDAVTDHLQVICNNVFRNNDRYGIEISGTSFSFQQAFVDYNLFSGNELGAVYWTDSTAYNEFNINGNGFGNYNTNGDPSFVSETNGEENFIPIISSPCIGNGMNNLTIGAYGRPALGGIGGETYIKYNYLYPGIETFANGEIGEILQ